MRLIKMPLACCLALSIPAFAEPYQWELSGDYGYRDHDFDQSGEGDDHEYNLKGTYYFQPVLTDKGPLAEAAFLSQASNVLLWTGYEESNRQFSSFCAQAEGSVGCSGRNRHNDGSAYSTGVRVEVFVPDSWLYFAGSYQYHDRESETFFTGSHAEGHYSSSYNYDYWSAEVGIMPVDGWLITTGFGEGDDLFDEDVNIASKYLWQLGDGKALSVKGAYFVGDGYNDWQLEADYYFTRTFSVGGNYSDAGYSEIRIEKFLTDSIAVEASYGDYRDGGYLQESQSYNVGVSARF